MTKPTKNFLTEVNVILQDREGEYGSYSEIAYTFVELYRAVKDYPYTRLYSTDNYLRDFTVMQILGKLSRYITGNRLNKDNIIDIFGYASLYKKHSKSHDESTPPASFPLTECYNNTSVRRSNFGWDIIGYCKSLYFGFNGGKDHEYLERICAMYSGLIDLYNSTISFHYEQLRKTQEERVTTFTCDTLMLILDQSLSSNLSKPKYASEILNGIIILISLLEFTHESDSIEIDELSLTVMEDKIAKYDGKITDYQHLLFKIYKSFKSGPQSFLSVGEGLRCVTESALMRLSNYDQSICKIYRFPSKLKGRINNVQFPITAVLSYFSIGCHNLISLKSMHLSDKESKIYNRMRSLFDDHLQSLNEFSQ